MIEVRILPPAAKFLKKLKDKQLKQLFKNTIIEIAKDPSIGEYKHGDLAGIHCCDIYYNKTNYELAYTIESVFNETNGKTEIVVVIMAGTRENFYHQLKNYWHMTKPRHQ